jgi:four helix bundle protein
MYSFSFEKLIVWQNSREISKQIYQITNDFPSQEKYGLVTQMRRAIISVVSNIAEGSSRNTSKDQAHFYNTAFSSLMEVLSQLILSLDLGFITKEKYSELRVSIEKIANQINSLRNSQLSKTN